MDTTKIKVKFGNYEFEAEGPVETVSAQFEAFKTLLSSIQHVTNHTNAPVSVHPVEKSDQNSERPHVSIENILHVAGRVVSLTAIPASTVDAALLIMLGHKEMRNNLSVTGQEIGDGLAQSGRPVGRVDRIMENAITEALVLKTGIKRGTRYRLTNQGLAKALSVASELIQTLP